MSNEFEVSFLRADHSAHLLPTGFVTISWLRVRTPHRRRVPL
jgi:hypothetical protein